MGTITFRSQRIFRPGQGLVRSRGYDEMWKFFKVGSSFFLLRLNEFGLNDFWTTLLDCLGLQGLLVG